MGVVIILLEIINEQNMKKLLFIFLLLPIFAAAQNIDFAKSKKYNNPRVGRGYAPHPINVHDSVVKYYNLKEKYKVLSGYTANPAIQRKCVYLCDSATAKWQHWFEVEDDSITRAKLKQQH